MNLSDLSLKERLLVAQRAERRCAGCLRSLAWRVRPPDPRLIQDLQVMAVEEERHGSALLEFDRSAVWPLVWRLDERAIDHLLMNHLPTLWADDGSSPADPEGARRKVAAIEDESVRFYCTLSAGAPDPKSRALFRELAEREEAHRPDGNNQCPMSNAQ